MNKSTGNFLVVCLQSIRQPLYYRLHGLRALLAHPGVVQGLRLVGWLAMTAWLLFVLLNLVLRFAVMPQVASYHGDIERTVRAATGQDIRIGRIEAHWRGWNPELVLSDVRLLDATGQPALTLERVDAVLSWQSLWQGRPVLALLAVQRPVLQVRRDTAGALHVAGIPLADSGDSGMADWLLAQHRLRISDATVLWEDDWRGAPALLLEDVQFGLDNRGSHRRFGLTGLPPAALAARLDLRGEIEGDLSSLLQEVSGQFYVALEYADLSAWQAWVDYPLAVSGGRGALRLWGAMDAGEATLTADVALRDVGVTLASGLPPLELLSLDGRFKAAWSATAWQIEGLAAALQTRQGLVVPPSDFLLARRQSGERHGGDLRVSAADLSVLRALLQHLPVDVRVTDWLARHAPEGRLSELKVSWQGDAEDAWRQYALSARFAGLGLLPVGHFPGGRGLSGSVDLNDREGRLRLEAHDAVIALPAVFPEPEVALDRLQGRVDWLRQADRTVVKIDALSFANADARGRLSGQYEWHGQGPGVADLRAEIDHAEGSAVWRYMPHAVNAETRDWLRRGIVRGHAGSGRMILQGNLADFPFREAGSGTFSVTAKAFDTRIDYAEGWPVIDGVQADMTFGVGMKIVAREGRILGADLSEVTVELPDFESMDELLIVRGTATGPTGEFLRFIEHSPVAVSIDRFTDGMRAEGPGQLRIGLDIPLRRPLDTRVDGRFEFQGNRVHLVEGLPPIEEVKGTLVLTESALQAEEIHGRTFGGPVRMTVRQEGGGTRIRAQGSADMTAVARHFAWPGLDKLTGTTPWEAQIDVLRGRARVQVNSDLVGVASPLPAPFGKGAGGRLPLRIDGRPMAGGTDQYRVALGALRGLLVRSQGQWSQGAFALGRDALTLPRRGMVLRIDQPSLNLDAWRAVLPVARAGEERPATVAGGSPMPLVVHLRTGQLRLFDRDYHQVAVQLSPVEAGWQVALATREAQGELLWRRAAGGHLDGQLKYLHLYPIQDKVGNSPLDHLPGLSLVVEDFRLSDKALGRLELQARNQSGDWLLEKLQLANGDGRLSASGVWRRSGEQETRLDFVLDASDAGRLMSRLGYAQAMRRGKARITGDVRWRGGPTQPDYASMAGDLAVRAEDGQFSQLEPGVGRLLGLISLQAIPRRLTLDFRDVFSDGLAFDRIEGKLTLSRGIMRTVSPMQIAGPAVLAVIEGQADILQETQDFTVDVQPELGSLAAVGTAALVNPIAGAAALVANTLFRKPLNQIFSYRYRVTGPWADPQVQKVASPSAAAATPDKESTP